MKLSRAHFVGRAFLKYYMTTMERGGFFAKIEGVGSRDQPDHLRRVLLKPGTRGKDKHDTIRRRDI